jgi:hypothetical protein
MAGVCVCVCVLGEEKQFEEVYMAGVCMCVGRCVFVCWAWRNNLNRSIWKVYVCVWFILFDRTCNHVGVQL